MNVEKIQTLEIKFKETDRLKANGHCSIGAGVIPAPVPITELSDEMRIAYPLCFTSNKK